MEAEAVADGFDCSHAPRPCVASRSFRSAAVHGHSTGVHDGEHGTRREVVGAHEHAAVFECDVTVGAGGTGEQVGAGELSDPSGARPAGDLGRCAGLGDASVVEDDDVVGEDGGVDGIVGDQETNTGKSGEVAAKVASDLVAGVGVEIGRASCRERVFITV